MNLGRYPDKVINEAVGRLGKGANPRDVADQLREKYGYEKLHWKTVGRWYEKYPMGKDAKSLPRKFKEEVYELGKEAASKQWSTRLRDMCEQGNHSFLSDPTLKNFVSIVLEDDGVNENGMLIRIETRTCPICGQESRDRDLAMFLY